VHDSFELGNHDQLTIAKNASLRTAWFCWHSSNIWLCCGDSIRQNWLRPRRHQWPIVIVGPFLCLPCFKSNLNLTKDSSCARWIWNVTDHIQKRTMWWCKHFAAPRTNLRCMWACQTIWRKTSCFSTTDNKREGPFCYSNGQLWFDYFLVGSALFAIQPMDTLFSLFL